MLIDKFLISLHEKRTTRAALLSELCVAVRDLSAADGVVIALQHPQSRAWVGYCPDSNEAVFGRGLSLYASTAFLEKVRAERRPLFQPTEVHRLDGSRSYSALSIKHALGAPLRDLNRVAGDGDFAGVLMVYRQDGTVPSESVASGQDFSNADLALVNTLAMEVNYAIKMIDERLAVAATALATSTAVSAPPLAAIKGAVTDHQGDLAKAALALGISRDQLKHLLARDGLLAWAKGLKQHYSPEAIAALVAELGDVRKVGRRLNRSYGTLHSFLRSRQVPGGLRGLVESRGLNWVEVHGPEFEAAGGG